MKNKVYIFIYIIVINIITFILVKIDKRKAKKKEFRISEKTFFTLSLMLGAFGTYIGMLKFRHKTKHTSFTIGIPIILIINLICIYLITIYLF